jgi:predicted 3-demethylubiquinone-9 3-methyltransferase (glyoxalase superfamily)
LHKVVSICGADELARRAGAWCGFRWPVDDPLAPRNATMPKLQTITPCLWFDDQAEEAARFYVSIFEGSKMGAITRYPESIADTVQRQAGSVMTVTFELEGQPFMGLNGGPGQAFSWAVSFVAYCDTQREIDELWEQLGAGGEIQQCGWLKDRFGLSWQIVPSSLPELLADPARAERVMQAVLTMTKLDLATLEQA